MPTGAGLRPGAKATEHPPDPTGGAPAPDPTDERRLETESRRGVRHRQRAKAAGNSYPHPPTATAPVVDSTDDRQAGFAARRSQKFSKRPVRMQQRRAMMALAPATVQRMPARLSRAPICLQPASSTPDEMHSPLDADRRRP